MGAIGRSAGSGRNVGSGGSPYTPGCGLPGTGPDTAGRDPETPDAVGSPDPAGPLVGAAES
jgi:hypothetical protein